MPTDDTTEIEFVAGPADGCMARIHACLPPPAVLFWDIPETTFHRRAWYAYDCSRHVYDFVHYDTMLGDDDADG